MLENIQQNGLAHLITVKKNNLLVGVEQKVELIVANIVAVTIIKLALQAKERLNQGGFFLVSGIIKERREEVFTALQEIGFVLREEKTQEDWVAQVWQLGV